MSEEPVVYIARRYDDEWEDDHPQPWSRERRIPGDAEWFATMGGTALMASLTRVLRELDDLDSKIGRLISQADNRSLNPDDAAHALRRLRSDLDDVQRMVRRVRSSLK